MNLYNLLFLQIIIWLFYIISDLILHKESNMKKFLNSALYIIGFMIIIEYILNKTLELLFHYNFK